METENKVGISFEDIQRLAVNRGVDPDGWKLEDAKKWLESALDDGFLPCLDCDTLWEPQRDSARLGDKCPDCRPDLSTLEKVQLIASNPEHGFALVQIDDGGAVLGIHESPPTLEKFENYAEAVKFFKGCISIAEKRKSALEGVESGA